MAFPFQRSVAKPDKPVPQEPPALNGECARIFRAELITHVLKTSDNGAKQ